MKARHFSRVLLLMAVLLPHSVFACSVCMGGNGTVPDSGGSPLGGAINSAIFLMLAFIGSVLAGISAFAISLYRRSKNPLAEHQQLAELIAGTDEGRTHA